MVPMEVSQLLFAEDPSLIPFLSALILLMYKRSQETLLDEVRTT